MNIKAIIGLVALVAVALGGWWLYTQNAPAGQGQVLEAQEFTEETEYTSIEVAYPAAIGPVRAFIEAAMGKVVADFRQNTAGLDATVMPSLEGRKLALVAEYKAYTGAYNTTSYAYTVYEDTGGAHPNGYFKTFVFDENGKILSLADMYAPNPNGLEELSLLVSNAVVAEMKQRTGQDDVTGSLFAEGLSPKEDNFQNFYLDGDTLVILIPPYQVAAYAVGSFEVRIPLTDIK